MVNNHLAEKLVEWRRDFHQYPETGFLEMRTASIVASILDQLGFELQMGKNVMSPDHCMGKPNDTVTKQHLEWARENGAHQDYIDYFSEGYTGIVATLDTNKNGPTVAYRFDMDALPINESDKPEHVPFKEGFRSILADKMHACGHDAHTSIGLGLASLIAENKDNLCGRIKLIFQPAEEGTRGAKSMVEANVVSDVDYFIASHVGIGVPQDHVVAANNGFLATSKIDISFKGKASHAGGDPEKGDNALLAAATASLNMSGISRHSEGSTRINIGELHAGSGRNIIPDSAALKVETRGDTSDINCYVKKQVESIAVGAATMYNVDYNLEVVGEGKSCNCSREVASVIHECAQESDKITESVLESNDSAGSEDATFLWKKYRKWWFRNILCIWNGTSCWTS